jgi:hypothetical protein
VIAPARAFHAIIALLALIGLAINYSVVLGNHPGAPVAALIRFLSFFTVLSNILVAIASIGIVIGRGWAKRPATRTAIAVYITVVAAIFQILLAGLEPLSPLGWWGNMLVHQLVPMLWLLGWIGFGPHGRIAATAPLRWLIFPTLYGAYTLAHGASTGFYPYPFLNVTKLGGAVFARNMALIGLLFLALGYLFRWLDARLPRRASH